MYVNCIILGYQRVGLERWSYLDVEMCVVERRLDGMFLYAIRDYIYIYILVRILVKLIGI